MTTKPLAHLVVLAALALPTSVSFAQGQQQAHPAQPQAVPRLSAPRASGPARESAPPRESAPQREQARQRESTPPPRQSPPPPPPAARQGAGVERPRGIDDAGRIRVPPRWDSERADSAMRAGEARRRDVPVYGTAPAPPTVQSAPSPAPSSVNRVESTAVPRWPTGRSPSTVVPRRPTGQDDDNSRVARSSANTANEDDQRGRGHAVPRESRHRGDNPVTGHAVPRPGPSPVRTDGRWVSSRYSYPTYHHYYYPRRYYPYGYGAFGLGLFYYNPYAWYPYYGSYYYGPYGYYGAYGYGYGYGYSDGYGYYGYDTGELHIRVTPRFADVYVDGYYAGRVDDFDGTFQSLRLEPGTYHIEIVAPGFEPLEFDVRIQAGQRMTYRGDLRSIRP
jgi:PEGA domain